MVPPEPVPTGLFSIFFPMWNEEEYIERAVEAARRGCEPWSPKVSSSTTRCSSSTTPRPTARRGSPTSWRRRIPTCGSSTTSTTASSAGRSRPASPRPGATWCSTPTPTCRSTWRRCHGRPAAAHLRRRHRQRLPVRPHRRGLPAGYLLLLLQPPGPDAVRRQARDINFAFKLVRRRVLDGSTCAARARSSTSSC